MAGRIFALSERARGVSTCGLERASVVGELPSNEPQPPFCCSWRVSWPAIGFVSFS